MVPAVLPGAQEWSFPIARTKSGAAAFGTLSPCTQRLVLAYIESLGVTLLDDAPIFRLRGFESGPRGGQPRAGVPYTKDSLVDDFADLRKTGLRGRGEASPDGHAAFGARSRPTPAAHESRRSRPRWAIRSMRTRRCRRTTYRQSGKCSFRRCQLPRG